MNFKKMFQRIQSFWKGRDKKSKLIIISTLVCSIICIIIIAYMYLHVKYEFLLSTSDSEVSSKVITELKTENIKYRVSGKNIEIAGANPDEVRLKLSGTGLLSSKDDSVSMFSKPLFIDEFQQKNLEKGVLEQKLESTIKTYNEISDARVQLTIGQQSSFKSENIPSKAGVVLTLKSKLSSKQVFSIQNLIAASVPNLSKENVVITDTDNNLLSGNSSDDGNMDYNSSYEKSMEDKISSQIKDLINGAYKNTNFKVVVRCNVNFDKTKIQKETVNSSPDTVISRQTETDKSANGDTSNSGTAGTTTNVPSYGSSGNNNSSTDKSSETVNYGLNKTTEETVKQPDISKITVAVTADRSLDQTDIDKITKTVTAAASIDTKRGDMISVVGFPKTPSDNSNNISKTQNNFSINKYKTPIILSFAGLLGLIILGLIIKTLKSKEESDYETTNLTDNEFTVPVESEEIIKRDTQREKIYNLGEELENNINDAAELLKEWKQEQENK